MGWIPTVVRPQKSCSIALVLFYFAAVNKHCVQKHGEQRGCLAYTSRTQFITEESQGRNSNKTGTWRSGRVQIHGGVLLSGLILLACSAYFLIKPCTTSPGIWALCHQLIIKKKCLTVRSYGGIFSIKFHPFLISDNSSLCQVDLKLSRTTTKLEPQLKWVIY